MPTLLRIARLMLVSALCTIELRAAQGELFEAVVILNGKPDDATHALRAGRRVALLAGASPELADAFGAAGSSRSKLFDSSSSRLTVAGHRACLVLVRMNDIRTIRLFTPNADADLLLAMLTAHELRHCHHDVNDDDPDTPIEQILKYEVDADRSALEILKAPGLDSQHDLARQAWIRWRNMDAFLSGKTDHWTVPWLTGATVTAKDVNDAEALRKRAARIMLDAHTADSAFKWEAIRRESPGHCLPAWQEILELIAMVYGNEPRAHQRALRGPPIG